MTEQINIHATLSDLDVEGGAEAFVFKLSETETLTFPSPEQMNWAEAEEFLQSFAEPGIKAQTIFKRWLSDEDYNALIESNLNMRQITKLVNLVTEHYNTVFGTSGND